MEEPLPLKKGISLGYLLLVASIAVMLFYGGFLLGQWQEGQDPLSGNGSSIIPDGSLFGSEETLDFELFKETWSIIEDSYLRTPVADDVLFYGALQGMVDALGDPYTTFFDPEMATEFTQELDGKFSGIGAEIGKRNDLIVIVSPLAGSPAESAGLLSGDYILSVDGEDTYDWSVNETVMKIRGEIGTPVTLSIYREATEETFDLTLTREEIDVDSVTWSIRDDGVAVIEVSMFNEETTPLFDQAVQDILAADAKGIVLDMRNNPGGLLTEAINLAGYWFDGKTAVIERVGETEFEFPSSGAAQLASIPTVILVNEGSASGTEILAGALQDYHLATLMGMQTFGKGSVQEYHEFPDGSALKVTVAEWLTPSGRSINEIGITPDQIIELTLDDYNAGTDPQFDTAIDFLTQR
ncbi:MAG: S41 family peptidase [Patescibacteria group bacterium]|jgi:carboxyl-terminal processing protease